MTIKLSFYDHESTEAIRQLLLRKYPHLWKYQTSGSFPALSNRSPCLLLKTPASLQTCSTIFPPKCTTSSREAIHIPLANPLTLNRISNKLVIREDHLHQLRQVRTIRVIAIPALPNRHAPTVHMFPLTGRETAIMNSICDSQFQ